MSIRRPHWGVVLSSFCLFSSGLACIVDEYILAQVSSNILGNPAEQWPVVIGLMLLATGVGVWVAQFIPDTKAVNAFITIEVLLSLIGSFSPLIIMTAYAYMLVHFKLVFYFIAFTLGFLIGFEQPLIALINQRFVGFRSNITMTLSLDAFGVAVGTILWVKCMVGVIPLQYASFMVGSLNLLVAIVTYIYLSRQQEVQVSFYTFCLLGLAVIGGGLGLYNSETIIASAEQQLFTGKIIHKEDTRFQHIVMTEHPKSKDVMLFLNGSLQFCSADEDRYHENLVHPAIHFRNTLKRKQQNTDPLNVLILGGGDGLAVREVKKYPNIGQVSLVELDPAITQLANKEAHLLALNDSALYKNDVSLIHKDAYTFVENSVREGQQYDVIIIDFPDPRNEALGKLYSKYFFHNIRLLLKQGGVVSIQASSPVHVKHAYICTGKTMTAAGLQVLPYHDNIPSFNHWGWYLAVNQLDDISLSGMARDLYTQKEFEVPTRYLTPERFFANTIFGKDILNDTEDIEINTLMNQKIVHYYLKEGWWIY